MSKVKKFTVIERPGYDDEIGYQEVTDSDTSKTVFVVWNLTGCPEDAMIEREVFNAQDWLRAVNFGIELGKAGYDFAEIRTVNKERDE